MNATSGSGMVLVIERDSRFSAKLKKHLRLDGHRLFFVESAQDAVFLLESISADFILANLNGIDAWENLKKLRAFAETNEVPLLLIDGMRKTQTVADRLRAKGGYSFITLPFSVSDLQKKIQAMMVGADPLIGLELGPEGQRVEILKKLGAGAMGAVYKACQNDLGRHVAVKLISRDHLGTDAESSRRFTNEARAMARLRSPYIAQVYFVGKHEGRPYLVMELIEGPDLEKYLRSKGTLSAQQALELVRDILRGLEEAHRAGIVHRDMKPSNIMLAPQGHPVILDFGLVRGGDGQNLTRSGAVLGTPRYMAPEQVTGKGIDHRADIYAVGIMLYEMVVGTAPFKSDDFVAVLMKHVNDPLPPPEQYGRSVKPALFSVIEKLTAKRPEERYQSVGEALIAVESCLENLSMPGSSDTQTIRRRAVPVGGLAVNASGHAVDHFGQVPEHRTRDLHLMASIIEQIGALDALGDFRRGTVDTDDRRLILFSSRQGLASIETREKHNSSGLEELSIEELAAFFRGEVTA